MERPVLRAALFAIVAVISSHASGAASAADSSPAPSVEALEAAIAAALPPFWQIKGVTVTASVNAGDAVTPIARERFEADAAAAANLFVADAAPNPLLPGFVEVLPSLAAGAQRKLYGTSNATFSAGKWEININLENGVSGLGQPLDLFAKPTLVKGSDQGEKLIALVRPAALAQAQAELAAETEELKGQAQEAVAKAQAAAQAKLAALEEQQAVELKELQANHDQEIAKVESDLAADQALIDAEKQRQKLVSDLADARVATAQKEVDAAARSQQATDQAAKTIAAERMKRLAQLQSAIGGKDPAAALTAFEAAIADEDQAIRTAAYDSALGSPLAMLPELAIRKILATSKTLSLLWTVTNEKEPASVNGLGGSITIIGQHESGDVLNFTGKLSGLFLPIAIDVNGTLSGSMLSISGDLPQDGYAFHGSGLCEMNTRYSNGAFSGPISCIGFQKTWTVYSGSVEIPLH